MTKNLSVRDFCDEDFAGLGLLWDATGVGNPARGDSLESIRRTKAQGGRLFVLEDSGRIIGSVWLTDDGRRLYVHHMAVSPDRQGQGLSVLLMKAAVGLATERNLQMKLEVHHENARAIALYRKFDFDFLGAFEVMIRRRIG